MENFINFNIQSKNIQPVNNDINYNPVSQLVQNNDYNSGQIEIKRKVNSNKKYEYLEGDQILTNDEAYNLNKNKYIYTGYLKNESQQHLIENPYLMLDYFQEWIYLKWKYWSLLFNHLIKNY